MKHKTKEAGLTLVELLAALTLASIIAIIAYGILFGGFKTYDRVKTEIDLRDEADVIMATLMSDLFTLKESEIQERHLPEHGTNNYYLVLTDETKIGFYQGQVYVVDGVLSALQGQSMSLSSNTKMSEVAPGQFHIFLTIKDVASGKKLTTESEISIINDVD